MSEHNYFYTDMTGLNEVLSDLTHGNINKWTELTRKLQESKDASVLRLGMNRFAREQPETITIAPDNIILNQETLPRDSLGDTDAALNGSNFTLRNYRFSTNTSLDLKIRQMLVAVDFEGETSFIPEKFYAVEVNNWGYEKTQVQKLFAQKMDKIESVDADEPKPLSFLQHYLQEDYAPVPVQIDKPQDIIKASPQKVQAPRNINLGTGTSYPSNIISGVKKQKDVIDENNVEPEYIERQNFHVFMTAPLYPYALQQSDDNEPGGKRYKHLNRDKVIASAICHYSEHGSFSQSDLAKTIGGVMNNRKITPIIHSLISEGHIKYISLQDRAENPTRNLALVSIPPSMNENDFYKIIKGFRGIPKINHIKVKQADVPHVAPLQTDDTPMNYGVIRQDELTILPDITKKFDALPAGISSFLYQFGPLFIRTQGGIKHLDLDENGSAIKAIYLQSTAITSPVQYIFAQPKHAGYQDKVMGTWDSDTVAPPDIVKEPTSRDKKRMVKMAPSYSALTLTVDEAMKVKSNMTNGKNHRHAVTSHMKGMFSCHLGAVAIPGYGMVTSLDYASGNAVHLIQFDSYRDPLPPQIVFVQSEKLDPDFQRMKHDVTATARNNTGIDGLAVALFNQQASKMAILGRQADQVRTIESLVR